MTAREAVEACAKIAFEVARKYDEDSIAVGDGHDLKHTLTAQAAAVRAVGWKMLAEVAVTP